jgi:predicted Fe-Mo cluster-binding NifX family protein
MGIPFLGSIPIERQLMEMSDRGQVYLLQELNPEARRAFEAVIANVIDTLDRNNPKPAAPVHQEEQAMTREEITLGDLKIAIPLAEGTLCNHFGHCEQFALIDLKGKEIVGQEMVTPPPHEPGLLPRWLGGKGVNLIIAGGMGQRALNLFSESGIKVLTGAPALPPEALISHFVNQTLVTGANVCDH